MTQPSTPSYPVNAIHDDWNERQPKPVTSFADDVNRAGNTPEPVRRSPEELADLVETSAGAVPSDSETAAAARDVAVKNPETVGVYALGGPAGEQDAAAGTEPGDSGATEPAATKSVSRKRNADD